MAHDLKRRLKFIKQIGGFPKGLDLSKLVDEMIEELENHEKLNASLSAKIEHLNNAVADTAELLGDKKKKRKKVVVVENTIAKDAPLASQLAYSEERREVERKNFERRANKAILTLSRATARIPRKLLEEKYEKWAQSKWRTENGF